MLEVNKIYHGHCMDLFTKLDDESVDCVITSPPYWQLRDYKWDGQWGLEPTFQEYLQHLWEMMEEIWRVLKKTGTVWINLGDTYGTTSNNMTSGNIIENKIKYTGGIDNYSKPEGLHKCLLLIPHRFAIGCIDKRWTLRNDIVWAKRNGMPESVRDRLSKKHEYFFLFVKEDQYYFDLDSIRDKHKFSKDKRNNGARNVYKQGKAISEDGQYATNNVSFHPNGKNPGSVSDLWDIPTKGSQDEHFAAYNSQLISRPILAGCPKGGTILDPFAGTGTTGCRAIELGRNFIGFEGSEKFVKMGNKNLQPYINQKQLF